MMADVPGLEHCTPNRIRSAAMGSDGTVPFDNDIAKVKQRCLPLTVAFGQG